MCCLYWAPQSSSTVHVRLHCNAAQSQAILTQHLHSCAGTVSVVRCAAKAGDRTKLKRSLAGSKRQYCKQLLRQTAGPQTTNHVAWTVHTRCTTAKRAKVCSSAAQRDICSPTVQVVNVLTGETCSRCHTRRCIACVTHDTVTQQQHERARSCHRDRVTADWTLQSHTLDD